jgi:predicted nucleotidyltransferase
MTIEQLFGSKLRAKLLGWFFTHVDERFFVRQLQSLLSEDPTNLSRELARLENLRILTSETEGRQKYFKVNKGAPFYEEMKGLMLKTTGVAGTIRSALEKIHGVKFAFLYGSFAKNQEKPESDVDLMIVGKFNFDELEETLSESEKQLGRTINITSYSLQEFQEKTRTKDGFIQTVLKGPKIMLIGDKIEFKRS